MLQTTVGRLALVSLMLSTLGCGATSPSNPAGPVAESPDKTVPEKPAPKKPALANTGRITLHVKDMTRLLNIA